RELAAKEGKKVAVNPYLIASHPGCTVQHMEQLARDLSRLKLPVRQFQDFTPTPGTIATAMYVSGLDRETRQPIHVAKKANERAAQRTKLEGAMAPAGRRKEAAASPQRAKKKGRS
ncbi:MAG TPA: YgiQ family radical SAM protein, partial [Desulfurivibrionaceae bacterium]|nr:YgiQ family radical SAM protein [Desulfurivibrionaceae bacterium]